MRRHFRATIVENRPVHPVHNLLTLSIPDTVPSPLPGQFFMLEANKGTDPLLKRAFSLFQKTGDGLRILYRVRGKGTEILKNMEEGTELDMLGPLGNCYPAPSGETYPVIVAGGIGIASVFSLVEQCRGRATVLFGARTKGDLLMIDEVRTLAKEVIASTDDGSEGFRGTAVAALQSFLSQNSSHVSQYAIYSCGPRPLLRAVAETAKVNRIPAYVSMEEHMACGIGACLGCVVQTRDGYARVCKEGPVFRSTEIVW